MDPFKDLNNLYFFARVVDFGSYTAAAEALGLQTSKLSRRVSALESELGVRLLNRTTRKLSLTEAGQTFHRHCAALIAEAFTPRLRYSGASLGYQLASIIAGGPAPLIATWLFAQYASGYAIAIYIAACAVVSFIATLLMPDYTGKDISDEAYREE